MCQLRFQTFYSIFGGFFFQNFNLRKFWNVPRNKKVRKIRKIREKFNEISFANPSMNVTKGILYKDRGHLFVKLYAAVVWGN